MSPAGKDLYSILGVSRTATADELRKAYRKLARAHHPDVNPGNKEAENRFKEISAAYDVLSDADRRKAFDEFGEASLQGGFDPEKARAHQAWSRTRAGAGQPFEAEASDVDLGDLFGDLFRKGAGRAAPGRRAAMRGEDLLAQVTVDFTDALRGTTLELTLPGRETCTVCHGSGDRPGTATHVCPRCGGAGRERAAPGPMSVLMPCRVCGGAGQVGTGCERCQGTGAVDVQRPVTVRVPPGADDGSRLRVAGKGAPGRGGGPPGDLVLETRVRPHPHFRREGLDLHLVLPVTIDEAYLGGPVDVPTPDGQVSLKIPPRSQTGTRLRLRGKGVARGGAHGDLYAELSVRIPDREDPALAEVMRRVREDYSSPVREGLSL